MFLIHILDYIMLRAMFHLVVSTLCLYITLQSSAQLSIQPLTFPLVLDLLVSDYIILSQCFQDQVSSIHSTLLFLFSFNLLMRFCSVTTYKTFQIIIFDDFSLSSTTCIRLFESESVHINYLSTKSLHTSNCPTLLRLNNTTNVWFKIYYNLYTNQLLHAPQVETSIPPPQLSSNKHF